MPLWIGRRVALGIGVETSRGVGVTPTYWVNPTSFSFTDVPERAISEGTFAGIWGGDQAPKTLERAEGEIEIEVDDKSFGAFLLAIFGSVSTATVDTSGKKHTYTLDNTNQHDSLTLHAIDPIGQLQFELAMIDTFELRFEPNAIVTASINFMSKGSNDSVGQTASFATVRKWLGRHLQFKVASATAGLAAAAKVDVRSLTLRFEKNTEVQTVLGTVQPIDIVNKRFNVTGEVTLNYEDRTWLNYVKDSTYRAVRINMIHDDLAGAATSKYEFLLDLSKVAFESFDPDFAMDDVATQTFQFTALYDAGGNNNVVNDCFLVNQVASY